MNEREARRSGRRVLASSFPVDRLTRAVLDGETEGLIRLLVDADTDELLGASVLSLSGDEIVQTVSALMHAGARSQVLAQMLPIHPTMTEFYPTILAGLEPLEPPLEPLEPPASGAGEVERLTGAGRAAGGRPRRR
jgi:pyruvate/2-oxoglutarate dehydrogenase complex dihydrolipoamide dehydrogenase (E3) component